MPSTASHHFSDFQSVFLRLEKMAPLVEAFHPARLQQHVQYHPNGKARKPPVDLKQCELKELIQYECDLDGPKENRKSRVVCEPLLRLFRQYVQAFLATSAFCIS